MVRRERERKKEGKIAQVCYDTGEICISSVGTHWNPRTVSLCTEVDIGRALVYRLSNINRQSSIRSLEVLKGLLSQSKGCMFHSRFILIFVFMIRLKHISRGFAIIIYCVEELFKKL